MSRSQGYPYFGISFAALGRVTYHPPMGDSPEADSKRVLIADDHPLYRDALRAIVPQALPNARMSEAGCQKDIVENVTSDSSFDLIVLDLNLPGATGLSCLRHLREVAQLTPIMVVSGNDDPAMMRDVVMAGATGYVPKSAPRQVLIDAIRVIMGGGTYLPTAAMLAMRQAQTPDTPLSKSLARDELTLRQRKVLQLLAEGLSNKHIARELQISEITVKAHVSLILKKLNVANRVQAAMEARRLLSE